MKRNCDFILDLLPLYAENVASEGTRNLVEAHLKSCDSCAAASRQMREQMVLPVQTDFEMLESYNQRRIKQRILSVLTVVLLLLVAAECLLIGYTVPIWLTAEEAIENVQDMGGGNLVVTLSDDVETDYRFVVQNSLYFAGPRLSLQETQPFYEAMGGKMHMVFGVKSLWYVGALSGEEDTLLWGDGSNPATEVVYDDTIEYVFYISLFAGMLCLVLSLLKWRGRTALRIVSTLLLCCAGACWFVTAGRFAVYPDYDQALELHGKVGMLTERLIHIVVLTVLSWGMIAAAWGLVKCRRSEKRRGPCES